MTDNLALIQAQYPFVFPAIAFIFGASIGSFLNVVIYRLPIMLVRDWQGQAIEVIDDALEDESFIADLKGRMPEHKRPFNLVVPNSKCPHCGSAIKPWHNIPILGYFLIGGKCASCKASISARYPIVETLTALLTMLVIITFGPTLAGIAACVLTWALITLALIVPSSLHVLAI
jgi:leader peptidase (prepilin peptidase)/N-methyltransferase